MIDAVVNVVSIVVFVSILVWLMRQSRRSLVGWHSADGNDFVATARTIDDSGTPTRWRVVRARLDPMTSMVSLLPRGVRSGDVRGTFELVGRPHESETALLGPRHGAFVLRSPDRDIVLRVELHSRPFTNLTDVVDRTGQ
jgi:hypothetical protein